MATRHKAAELPEGVTVSPITIPPKDMLLFEEMDRRRWFFDVANSFGIPERLMSDRQKEEP